MDKEITETIKNDGNGQIPTLTIATTISPVHSPSSTTKDFDAPKLIPLHNTDDPQTAKVAPLISQESLEDENTSSTTLNVQVKTANSVCRRWRFTLVAVSFFTLLVSFSIQGKKQKFNFSNSSKT